MLQAYPVGRGRLPLLSLAATRSDRGAPARRAHRRPRSKPPVPPVNAGKAAARPDLFLAVVSLRAAAVTTSEIGSDGGLRPCLCCRCNGRQGRMAAPRGRLWAASPQPHARPLEALRLPAAEGRADPPQAPPFARHPPRPCPRPPRGSIRHGQAPWGPWAWLGRARCRLPAAWFKSETCPAPAGPQGAVAQPSACARTNPLTA